MLSEMQERKPLCAPKWYANVKFSVSRYTVQFTQTRKYYHMNHDIMIPSGKSPNLGTYKH